MTSEEAQELIAEIKNKFASVDYDEIKSIAAPFAIAAEKIINRFANKPPEEGYTLYNNCSQEINIHYVDRDTVIVLRANGRYQGEFVMSCDLLKQHIGHCNKMLEYLDES